MKLTAEEKLLLFASRLDPSEKAICEISEAIGKKKNRLNFEKIYHLAVRNGVIQLVYHNLKNVSGMPRDLLSKLKTTYLHTAADNLRKINELLKITNTLKERGIQAIPIKGALASEMIFNEIGLYHGIDIDLLVHPSKLKDVKQILIDMGYSYNKKTEKDTLSSHYHLAFGKGKIFVEIHWNLVKRYFNIPSDFWWEDTQTVEFDGREIICLSPEKYLMALIFRLFSHMFFPLKFFVITSELCNKNEKTMNWNLFLSYANRYGMQKLSFFTLKLLNEYFDTKVPEQILN